MKFQERRQEKKKEEKKFKPLEEEKEGKKCPKCGAINELEAGFCAECGYDFSGERRCAKCGTKVSPNADICEVCGEWLLEGKCKFCYADLEEGATFCAECGNPVAGVVCPQCGELSYFDFCKNCNIPLTAMAKKSLEDIKNDPKEQELLHLLESVVTQKKEPISTEKEEILKMKEYIERVEKKNKRKSFTPLFSKKQKESIKITGKAAQEEIKRQEEERRRREEEERRRKEEERRRQEEEKRRLEEERRKLQSLLNQMKNKTFTTNQEARRYYRGRRPVNPRGWCCNFTGTVHPSPEDCAEPWHGGYWVI